LRKAGRIYIGNIVRAEIHSKRACRKRRNRRYLHNNNIENAEGLADYFLFLAGYFLD